MTKALECLKNNSKLFDEIALENPTTYKNETFVEAYLFKTNTLKIEQALLKAQEQEKTLEILKKYIYYSNKSHCIRMREIRKSIYNFDYEDLKEVFK